MASPAFPEPPPSSAPTALPEAERILQKLAEKKEIWVQTSLSDRIRLLQACIETTVAAAEGWVRDAAKAKGLSPELEGEEWTSGPMVTIRNLRMLAETLEKNAHTESPRSPPHHSPLPKNPPPPTGPRTSPNAPPNTRSPDWSS
jgi:hypothetical protein